MTGEGRELQRDLTQGIDIGQENIQVTEVAIENILVNGIIEIILVTVIEMIQVIGIVNILVIAIINIQVIAIEGILETGIEGEVLVLKDIEHLHGKGGDILLRTDLMKDADTQEKTDRGKGGGILLTTDQEREEDILQKKDTGGIHQRVGTGKGLLKKRSKRRNQQKILHHLGRLQGFQYLCLGNI